MDVQHLFSTKARRQKPELEHDKLVLVWALMIDLLFFKSFVSLFLFCRNSESLTKQFDFVSTVHQLSLIKL